MSDTIFKAIVTHFESGQNRLHFGNTIYEIYPSMRNDCVLLEGQSSGEGPNIVERQINFDKACAYVANQVESKILEHWSQNEQ